MATGKAKGILDSATAHLREATGSLKGEGPWHSTNSDVYHNNRNCQTGNRSRPRTFNRGAAASSSAKSANGSTARVVR